MGDYLDYLTSGLATHEDLIKERPDLVHATLRAEIKAHRYMQQNRLGTSPTWRVSWRSQRRTRPRATTPT